MKSAPILNIKESQRTVRSKKNINLSKPVLFTPYKLNWPKIEPSKQEIILEKLKEYFIEKNPKSSILEIPSKSKRKYCYRPLNQIHIQEEEINIRTQLITGIKEVTRHATRGNLKLIIVDRLSPWQLHRHLIQIASQHSCCAVAIDNLSLQIAPLLELTCVSALGFKKTQSSDSKYFNELVDFIEKLAPVLEVTNFHNLQFKDEDNKSLIDSNEAVPTSQLTHDNNNLHIVIPKTVCFLNKKKLDKIDSSNNKINEECKSYIKLDNNEETDLLFRKVPVFVSLSGEKELNRMQIETSVTESPGYVRSDIRKILTNKKTKMK